MKSTFKSRAAPRRDSLAVAGEIDINELLMCRLILFNFSCEFTAASGVETNEKRRAMTNARMRRCHSWEREREGDCLLLGMIDKYEEGKLKWDKSGELFITLRQIGLI